MTEGEEQFTITLSIVIGAIVICLLAITFMVLFALWGKQRQENIDAGLSDKEIEEDLRKKYRYDTSRLISLKNHFSYVDKLKKEEQRQMKISKIYNIVFYIVIAILIFVFGFSLFLSKSDSLYFGDSIYVTIQTGSMSYKNAANVYLYTNSLDNQISQYSLIGLDKVKSKDDLSLYDIAAYENPDGKLIVHRIINIDTDSSGETYYTFRGDANDGSLSYEVDVPYEDVEWVFNGFSNFGLGMVITYCKSVLGMIAISAAIVFLIGFDWVNGKVDKSQNNRSKIVAERMDSNNEIEK